MALHPLIDQRASTASAPVSFEEYLARYAADHTEWVNGSIIHTSPIHERHDSLTLYLAVLLAAYLQLRPIAALRREPFVMRLPGSSGREPDLQIILNERRHLLRETYMDGAADLCIEVVSLDSIERDRGERFAEYERGGVNEYWIIDPLRNECRFYRLNSQNVYIRAVEDADGIYQTPLLPGLRLSVPTLWQAELPGPITIAEQVRTMLAA